MSTELLGTMPEYDRRYCDWTLFRYQIDCYLACNVIPVDQHKGMLLEALAEETLQDLRDDLPSTITIEDLSYAELMERCDKMVTPKNVFRQRQTFYRAAQNEIETMTEWLKRVEMLAEDCCFGKEQVRDRFICGLRSSAMLDRLNEERNVNISIQKAAEICCFMEKENERKEDVQIK